MSWTAWEKELVRQRGYHAIYFAASLQPVTVLTRAERQMLDREGANIRISDVKNEEHPCTIGLTANLTDAQTPNLDGKSPHYTMRVHWRLWCPSRTKALFLKQAARLAVEKFPQAEPMRKEFMNGGPSLCFQWVMFETQMLAQDKNVFCLTDEELKAHLRAIRDKQYQKSCASVQARATA